MNYQSLRILNMVTKQMAHRKVQINPIKTNSKGILRMHKDTYSSR